MAMGDTRIRFTVTGSVELHSVTEVDITAYNEACEQFVEAVEEALTSAVDDYPELGAWSVTTEGTG